MSDAVVMSTLCSGSETASRFDPYPIAPAPLHLVEDRGMAVPAGLVVRTGYVPIEDVVFACRDRMAVGDVERAYRKRLQLGSAQPWPCPNGRWRQDGRFVVHDGRHEIIACLMLGVDHVLVAWTEQGGVAT